jgi:hypothetical protein
MERPRRRRCGLSIIWVAFWHFAVIGTPRNATREHAEHYMEIKAVDGKLSIGSLFGPVAIGYAIGAGVIFLPMFLLMGLLFAFSPGFVDQNGQNVSGAAMALPMIIMVPFIVVMQGVMFGGLVLLGLAIYRKWGTLRVTSVRETPDC